MGLHWQSRQCGDSSHTLRVAQNDIVFLFFVLIVTSYISLLHGRGAPLPYKAIFTHIIVKFSAYAKGERKEIHPRPQAFHMAKPYFTCEANFTNPERDLFRLSSGGRPMVAPTVWRRSQQKRYCGQTKKQNRRGVHGTPVGQMRYPPQKR